MEKNKLSDLIYTKVSQKMDLTPLAEFEDLETIVTPDGRTVGTFRAYTAAKVKKFSIAQFSIAPGMDYINAVIKPTPQYNISRFACNYMKMPDKIQFDVDLYPAVDIAVRQDFIDKYYEQLTDIYLKGKNADYFDWKLSDRSYVRAGTSPYFFMSAADVQYQDTIHSLIITYLDVALQMFDEEEEVSPEEARHIEYRLDYINRILLEREPERAMVEKAFGKQLTERLGMAMT